MVRKIRKRTERIRKYWIVHFPPPLGDKEFKSQGAAIDFWRQNMKRLGQTTRLNDLHRNMEIWYEVQCGECGALHKVRTPDARAALKSMINHNWEWFIEDGWLCPDCWEWEEDDG